MEKTKEIMMLFRKDRQYYNDLEDDVLKQTYNYQLFELGYNLRQLIEEINKPIKNICNKVLKILSL